MKRRISVSFAMAGLSVMMLTSCVSSKKYKASQASLAQVRADSAQMATQMAGLNQNIQTMDQKNKDLQTSLDKTTANYTTTSESLGYYQNYFDKQQASNTTLSQELNSSLAASGITDANLQQANGSVAISLDEKNIFKTNSTAVSTKGKQVLDGIASVIKTRQDLNVSVDNNGGEPAIAESGTDGSSTGNAAGVTSGSNNSSNASGTTSARKSNTVRKSTANRTASVKYKAPRKTSVEGGRTYASGSKLAKSKSATALKTGRATAVANHFQKSGIPKVNVVHQAQPGAAGNSMKVVLTPTMTDFTPPAKAAGSGN